MRKTLEQLDDFVREEILDKFYTACTGEYPIHFQINYDEATSDLHDNISGNWE